MRVPLRFRSLALLVAVTGAGILHGDDRKPCLMQPAHALIQLPARGFAALDGEAETDCARDVPSSKWRRGSAGPLALFVFADGPAGSGRYWNVAVGISSPHQQRPVRGVCLTTSTVGWRTLQLFAGAPLRWVDDLDGDGKAELIIWDSFSLGGEDTAAEFGLTAWVYRPNSAGVFLIDWVLTRRLARDIAAVYREAPPVTANSRIRFRAAAALELFANDQCTCGSARTR